jgi:hypothetical protein
VTVLVYDCDVTTAWLGVVARIDLPPLKGAGRSPPRPGSLAVVVGGVGAGQAWCGGWWRVRWRRF